MAGRQDIRIHALAFLAGVLLIQQLPKFPSFWWSLLLIPIGFAAYRCRAFVVLLVYSLGMLWAAGVAYSVLSRTIPSELEGEDLWLTGVVVDLPHWSAQSVRFNFDVVSLAHGDTNYPSPGKIQLRWYDTTVPVQLGEKWRLRVRLKRPRGFQNPGGVDYEARLFQQRIRATGYVKPHSAIVRLSPARRHSLDRYRWRLWKFIDDALRQHPTGGIIAALAMGGRDGIEPRQWQILRSTGTAHLVAISGLHIGLAGGFGYWLGSLLWRTSGWALLRLAAPRAGAIAALVVGFVYAALAGFSIPTQRSLIMLAVVMIGVLLQRTTSISHLLAVALLAVLIWDPLAVMSPGFWLSFCAVAIIAITARSPGSATSVWWRWGYVQLSLSAGLFPLLILLFQQASLVSPIANAVAVPVVGFAVVPLTLLAIGAYSIGLLGGARLLLGIAAGVFDAIWFGLDWLASQPLSLWVQHRPATWTLLAATVGILLLFAPRGFPARWLGTLWLAPLFLLRPLPPSPGEFELSLLDVGQGLSVVVRTSEHVLVYDTGARFGPTFDLGQVALVPFLYAQGVKTVDTVIVSHGDNDHIGGMASLTKHLRVTRVLSSVPHKVSNGAHCLAGQYWRWDGVVFQILSPVTITSPRDNNASCVLKVSGEFGSVLITGDIEAPAEQALLQAYDAELPASVLVVPHHGSITSSTPAFIDAVRPQLGLVSVGHLNRYGHPHPKVRERYAERDTPVLTTAGSGAIRIHFGRGGITVCQYRLQAQRYWFAD